MAYIGKQPQIGNYSVLDALTASSTNSYTMQLGSTNFIPESANHLIVSLNGVIQKPGSSFTVSGSTITFIPSSGTLSSSDSIDFIIALGNVLDIGTPSDNTIATAKIIDDAVTAAKFNADVISGQTELAAEPADTDEFLVSDAGVLKRIDYSLIKGGGITEADMYRLTSNFASSVDPISSNLERVDDASFAKIGTGMSVSSGIFTFAATGLYEVTFNLDGRSNSTTWDFRISVTQNNSSYDLVAMGQIGSTDNRGSSGRCSTFVNVTNTSNVKVKFLTTGMNGSDTDAYGDTDTNRTCFSFIRLGDSQ